MMTFQTAPTFPNIARIISAVDGLVMLATVDRDGPKLLISAEGMSPDPAAEVTLDAAQVKFLRDQLNLWLVQNGGQ